MAWPATQSTLVPGRVGPTQTFSMIWLSYSNRSIMIERWAKQLGLLTAIDVAPLAALGLWITIVERGSSSSCGRNLLHLTTIMSGPQILGDVFRRTEGWETVWSAGKS
ncbi:hypothetical protein CPB83DRAFT_861348 [Crepidotus variabilis]|uniref:Uncharacterized protein n=1 Tax=Crepidotus variabilis TaxID=179855 RepID=A0A9P6E8H6_9AGAR|nr:hypothetical protein CPB83DRAFT_861348 [Crepidotus variabilis]